MKTIKVKCECEDTSQSEPNFLNDKEKMRDFRTLTKSEFLKSYSYITEQEYKNTEIQFFRKELDEIDLY